MEIPETKWELGEPNIESALRKNKKGICAHHKCTNLLDDPPATDYSGINFCAHHRKDIDKMFKEWDKGLDEDRIELLNGVFKINEKRRN